MKKFMTFITSNIHLHPWIIINNQRLPSFIDWNIDSKMKCNTEKLNEIQWMPSCPLIGHHYPILSSDWSDSDSDWPGAACYRSPGKDPSLPPSCRSLQRGEDDRTIQASDWSQHPHTGLLLVTPATIQVEAGLHADRALLWLSKHLLLDS